jgi:predicted metal-dependent hydrolase
MTMHEDDTVEIFRNHKTGDFRIQPYARAKLSSQPFGQQTALEASEAEHSLLPAVLQNLDKNSSQKYVTELAPRSSEEEFRRSLKEDQLVYVKRSQGTYRIIPFRRMGNSWGSVEGVEVSVSEKEFLKRGLDLIREGFGQVP